MADVVFLNDGQGPPDDTTDHILIIRHATTGLYDTARHDRSKSYHRLKRRGIAYDHASAKFEQALQLAQQDAESFGIEKIYVVGVHRA